MTHKFTQKHLECCQPPEREGLGLVNIPSPANMVGEGLYMDASGRSEGTVDAADAHPSHQRSNNTITQISHS